VFSGTLSDYWGKRKPLAWLAMAGCPVQDPCSPWPLTIEPVFTAGLIDRCGRGIRGAPRDALVADHCPSSHGGAAFGLRQSLDTGGRFIGPLLAMGLMLLWATTSARLSGSP